MKKRLVTCLLMMTASFAATAAEKKIETPKPEAPKEITWPKIQNCRCNNIFTVGEFLYWRFSSPNLAYGRDGIGLSNSSPITEIPVVKTGTSFFPNFQYDPGFRIGLGAKFGPGKAFDLVGYYSWLRSGANDHVRGGQISASFLPINFLVSSTIATNSYSFASLDLNLHFNWFEVQSGYSFSPNRYITLRPYVALQAMIVEGDLHARYDYTITTASGGAPAGTFEIAKTHGDCSSWCIGPRIGLDFILHPTKCLGVFSTVNLTQQSSSIHMRSVATQNRPALGTEFIIQRGKLHANHNVLVAGLELGPTWDQWFCCQRYHLHVRATWSVGNLATGAILSFLNSNNTDIIVGSEFRGLNVRALFEF